MNRSSKISKVDCLGLGIIPLDFLIQVTYYPPAGGKIDASALSVMGGGPIPNALTGLSRMGLSITLIAAVGDDLVGRLIREELKKENIDSRFIIVKKNKQSDSAYGFVEAGSGRRTIALYRKIRITARDLTLNRYPIPRLIHLDGRDLDACLKLARWGRKKGALISFDIGSRRNDVSPVFPMVDHLIVSDVYAFGFTGKKNARSAILKLKEYCPGTIVITEGIKGSVAYENDRWHHQHAFRVKNIDTTGAGDAFHAGYLYGLLKGFSLGERLTYGAAAAALKCTRLGARNLPTLNEIRRFLKNRPRRYV
ncbi:MAG: PfkB family carbohydrate kinase [candidate division Zixibacteria bacterium]|nr:PfkB family carbohydrate kinase [candidate division Zixibacteria bacterium]MDD5427257.1 PfkB family carbohydrate kinase [candidate division Zixibacteria bacterium]